MLCCSAAAHGRVVAAASVLSLSQCHTSSMLLARDFFLTLVLLVLSIKRHGPSWLQHTNRPCIALRIICGLSTVFIHDYAKRLPIAVWEWCANRPLYPSQMQLRLREVENVSGSLWLNAAEVGALSSRKCDREGWRLLPC